MSLATGTKVKIRAFEGEVVAKTSMSGLGMSSLDDGFIAVEDEEGLVHAFWFEGEYSDETSVVQVAESFEENVVYKDAAGTFWMYDTPGLGAGDGWYRFGSVTRFGFTTPVRPLTRVGG